MKILVTDTAIFIGSHVAMRLTQADVSELIGRVGYRPKILVEEGVASFVEWYRRYYGVQA